MSGYQQLPDHVRRIIEREGDVQFTPPSFERWLGRLYMTRTFCAMGAFLVVTVVAVEAGHAWEAAAVRGIVAAIVIHFFAWAAGLLLFGELYDVEVKQARRQLEERERERARRIEEYYRERLREQEAEGDAAGGPQASVTAIGSAGAAPSYAAAEPQRYAA